MLHLWCAAYICYHLLQSNPLLSSRAAKPPQSIPCDVRPVIELRGFVIEGTAIRASMMQLGSSLQENVPTAAGEAGHETLAKPAKQC